MFRQFLNLRTGLAIIAISIVTGTIFYSEYVAKKIRREERSRVTAFGESLKIKAATDDPNVLEFTGRIAIENDDIPIIETDEKGVPTGNYMNLDSAKIEADSNYLRNKVKQYAAQNDPVKVEITNDPLTYNVYYYGQSKLQGEVRYYPLVQLLIVGLFIFLTVMSLRSSYRSVQNQVWAGMAKETAHQLGTPVSSLEGWVEMLREKPGNEQIAAELEKDVNRLRLVSDRFGKIGSTPVLEEVDLKAQIDHMVEYMRKRATGKIRFSVEANPPQDIRARVSPPLFDWVIENLLKNALDAMEGQGAIRVEIRDETKAVIIDVTDTGKGISKANIANVFKPGFTTKKRGWGLGLSLSRRIIEQYHKGEIYVKQSEPGRGTTFRIMLRK